MGFVGWGSGFRRERNWTNAFSARVYHVTSADCGSGRRETNDLTGTEDLTGNEKYGTLLGDDWSKKAFNLQSSFSFWRGIVSIILSGQKWIFHKITDESFCRVVHIIGECDLFVDIADVPEKERAQVVCGRIEKTVGALDFQTLISLLMAIGNIPAGGRVADAFYELSVADIRILCSYLDSMNDLTGLFTRVGRVLMMLAPQPRTDGIN